VELISNNSIGTICLSKIEEVKSEYLLPNTKKLNKGNILAWFFSKLIDKHDSNNVFELKVYKP
jgi:hypothetical protein